MEWWDEMKFIGSFSCKRTEKSRAFHVVWAVVGFDDFLAIFLENLPKMFISAHHYITSSPSDPDGIF